MDNFDVENYNLDKAKLGCLQNISTFLEEIDKDLKTIIKLHWGVKVE
jgi:hypothetical protein